MDADLVSVVNSRRVDDSPRGYCQTNLAGPQEPAIKDSQAAS